MSRIRLPFSSDAFSVLKSLISGSGAPAWRSSTQCLQNTYRSTQAGPITFARGMAKKRKQEKADDPRITMVHYALFHPKTPRTLKFGYDRHLRHWTIYRAWQLYKHKQKKQRDMELEKQYQKIRQACEALKEYDEKLFRVATDLKGVGEFPLELRIPTDTPPRNGFNEAWTKAK